MKEATVQRRLPSTKSAPAIVQINAEALAATFVRLEPGGEAFPRPRVPMLPVLGRHRASTGPTPVSRFLANDGCFLASGTVALALALRDLGLAHGHEVLLPDYHCPSMVLPVPALGGTPVFYPVPADLAIIPEGLEPFAGARTRALVLPHFFGFPQRAISAIAAWCRSRGVALIEDCAHAFFGELAGQPLGAFGDYAIASTRKFFPGAEGGMLVWNTSPPCLVLAKPSLGRELKNLYDTVHLAALAGRLGAFRRLFPARPVEAHASPAPTPTPAYRLDERLLARAGSRFAHTLVRLSDHAAIASTRRHHYQQWLTATAGLRNATPLYPALPEGVVPYVFPLRVTRPDQDFPRLKWAGLPIWRWDTLAVSASATSQELGRCLLQLPCHQSLADEEMDFMLATLHGVLAAADTP